MSARRFWFLYALACTVVLAAAAVLITGPHRSAPPRLEVVAYPGELCEHALARCVATLDRARTVTETTQARLDACHGRK